MKELSVWVVIFFLIVTAFAVLNTIAYEIIGYPVPDDLTVRAYIFALLLVILLRMEDAELDEPRIQF